MSDSPLAVTIAGLTFKNPVIPASGTFGYGLEFLPFFDLSRLGGFCTKGLSPSPLKGNPPPRIVETPAGMLNAIGLQNVGVRAFVAEKLPHLRAYDTHVIANVFGFSVEDFLEVVAALNDAEGVAAYELNISCPNVKEGGTQFGNDPVQAARVTEAVKRLARRPVIVKLSPNAPSIVEVARAVEQAGADAVSLINTFVGLAIDVHTHRPRLGFMTGGLSGPAIRPLAVRMVYEVSQAVRIPRIGMGGIATWMDALEFILAGATAVQIGTINYTEPQAALQIIDGLGAYCRERATTIAALVGAFRP
ncbi:dihydroorotate dehydrogenase [Chloracidobacterium validum]|uniref:Dihydroorotate dehydrogenase n=1 Tax=Chloracidobacterium validum TaxID=2821543 RepID=A0ABX8BC90_9BACT|nr:dihydroorotate dehydrogenase [Chloracidobacterium validum]QUW04553.1 dihydroorotate dehydrogenase [Chloracidobacterium validum]